MIPFQNYSLKIEIFMILFGKIVNVEVNVEVVPMINEKMKTLPLSNSILNE